MELGSERSGEGEESRGALGREGVVLEEIFLENLGGGVRGE